MASVRASFRVGVSFALASVGALLVSSPGALAAELELPVPQAVVYPGQPVVGLDQRAFVVKDEKIGLFVVDAAALEGMVARRTLLPGKAIRHSDLKAPDLVRAGKQVTMRYSEVGLVITGVGTALRSAGAGETVRVRNDDSGVVVSGRVAEDGSVEVSG